MLHLINTRADIAMNGRSEESMNLNASAKKRVCLVSVPPALMRKLMPKVAVAENRRVAFPQVEVGNCHAEQGDLLFKFPSTIGKLRLKEPLDIGVEVFDAMNRPPDSRTPARAKPSRLAWLSCLKRLFAYPTNSINEARAASRNAEFATMFRRLWLAANRRCDLGDVLYGFDAVLSAVDGVLALNRRRAARMSAWVWLVGHAQLYGQMP